MNRIKGEDVSEFVWGVCKELAELDVTETEPGDRYDEGVLQDRYSVAFLTNPSLFDLLDNLCAISQVVEFVEATIMAFGHIPCGSVKYIEALLMNPSLFKMMYGRLGLVQKG